MLSQLNSCHGHSLSLSQKGSLRCILKRCYSNYAQPILEKYGLLNLLICARRIGPSVSECIWPYLMLNIRHSRIWWNFPLWQPLLILCLHYGKLFLELSFPKKHVVCFILSLAPRWTSEIFLLVRNHILNDTLKFYP